MLYKRFLDGMRHDQYRRHYGIAHLSKCFYFSRIVGVFVASCAKHLISIQLLLQCKVDLLYMGAVILFLFYPAGAFSMRSALALPRGGNFCFVIAGKQAVGFKKKLRQKRILIFRYRQSVGAKMGFRRGNPLKVVARPGIEPGTQGFSVLRSTN